MSQSVRIALHPSEVKVVDSAESPQFIRIQVSNVLLGMMLFVLVTGAVYLKLTHHVATTESNQPRPAVSTGAS